MVSKLDSIWCWVTDMDRSVAFYRDVLGAELHFQSEHWTSLTLGGAPLGLHGGGGPSGENGWVIGFAVESASGFQEYLKSKAVDVEEELHEVPGGLLVTFRDPDRNTLQGIQRG